jgi:hypothetical protein
VIVGLHDPVGQDDEPDRRGQRAGDVELARRARVAPRGVHDAQRREPAEQPDRHVDDEDPAPAERLGEQPAEQCAGRAADRSHRPPKPERAVALVALGEAGREDRERRRRHDGAAEPLRGARADERQLVLRQPAGERRQREQREAAREHLAPPEQVGCAAAEQQEARERERVRVDDPGEARGLEAEVGRDRRQRHVHDRDVEHDHELRDAAEHEREGALTPGGHPVK